MLLLRFYPFKLWPGLFQFSWDRACFERLLPVPYFQCPDEHEWQKLVRSSNLFSSQFLQAWPNDHKRRWTFHWGHNQKLGQSVNEHPHCLCCCWRTLKLRWRGLVIKVSHLPCLNGRESSGPSCARCWSKSCWSLCPRWCMWRWGIVWQIWPGLTWRWPVRLERRIGSRKRELNCPRFHLKIKRR